MSISAKTRRALKMAPVSKAAADEVANTISVASVAANVAALGSTINLTAIAGVYADLAAARTSVNTLKGEVEVRLDNVEAKVDAVIAALILAGIMSA